MSVFGGINILLTDLFFKQLPESLFFIFVHQQYEKKHHYITDVQSFQKRASSSSA